MEFNIVATILYITLYCSSNEFIKLRIRKVNPKLIKLLKIVDGDGGLESLNCYSVSQSWTNKEQGFLPYEQYYEWLINEYFV